MDTDGHGCTRIGIVQLILAIAKNWPCAPKFPRDTQIADYRADRVSIARLRSSHIRPAGACLNFRFPSRSGDDKTAGGPAQDARVARKRLGPGSFYHTVVERQKPDSTLPDSVLAAIELVLAAPRLDHCRAAAQRAV